MLLIPLLLSLSSGLFDVPDTSAWKIQTDARVTATSSLPGADGFYPAPGSSNGTQLLSTDAGASAGGLQLRIAVKTPQHHGFAGILGMGLGQRSAKWDNTITTRTADVTTVIKPELELNTMVLELAAGAEWRPLSRHALSLEAIVPFQIGDGTLVHKIGGTVHYDASAPKSFRQSHSPRVMIGYDYRLLDRIDIGIGTSVIGADYFSETPTFTTDNGQTRTLSDPALSNHWLEYHLGWTFAL